MKNHIILIFLVLMQFSPLWAQTKQFTLEDAIRTAIENNYETKSKVLEINKAQAAVNEAFGYALPTIGISSNFAHFLETPKMPFPDFEAMLTNATYSILFDESVIPRNDDKYLPMKTILQSFQQSNSYEAKIEFSQILFNSAVFRGIGASGTYLETSKVALRSNIVSTVNNVRKAFYSVLLTQSLLEITKASFENAQKNLSNVKALKNEGLVSEFDALQAEVQVENIRPVVMQMENTLKLSKEALKLQMGISETENIDVIGELIYADNNFPNSEEAVTIAMQNNYDIRTLEYKQRVDDAFVDLHRAEYWPTIVAFGNYSLNGSSNDFNFQNYRSSMIGLSFSINLFSGMQTKNRVEQGLIEVEKTEQLLSQTRHAIAMQVKNHINEISSIKSNIEAQQRNVSLAERSYELATLRYREGTGNQLEIQNSDLALRQAKTNLLQSYYDYSNAQSELQSLLGDIDTKYFLMHSKYFDNNK